VGGDRRSEPARDPSGLDEILATFAQDGFVCDMRALAGGAVQCAECSTASPAGEFAVAALRRTEGASDPGDMSAVVALACPNCGARGTVVLRFGPEAGEADDDVLAALRPPGGTGTS
jgi:hypothetical protein